MEYEPKSYEVEPEPEKEVLNGDEVVRIFNETIESEATDENFELPTGETRIVIDEDYENWRDGYNHNPRVEYIIENDKEFYVWEFPMEEAKNIIRKYFEEVRGIDLPRTFWLDAERNKHDIPKPFGIARDRVVALAGMQITWC